jgi:hypothetical protein
LQRPRGLHDRLNARHHYRLVTLVSLRLYHAYLVCKLWGHYLDLVHRLID